MTTESLKIIELLERIAKAVERLADGQVFGANTNSIKCIYCAGSGCVQIDPNGGKYHFEVCPVCDGKTNQG